MNNDSWRLIIWPLLLIPSWVEVNRCDRDVLMAETRRKEKVESQTKIRKKLHEHTHKMQQNITSIYIYISLCNGGSQDQSIKESWRADGGTNAFLNDF